MTLGDVDLDQCAYLEFHDSARNSHKFYFAFHRGSLMGAVWGRIPGFGRGQSAQIKMWECHGERWAGARYHDQVGGKLAKGYRNMTLDGMQERVKRAVVGKFKGARWAEPAAPQRAAPQRARTTARPKRKSKAKARVPVASPPEAPREVTSNYFGGRRIQID